MNARLVIGLLLLALLGLGGWWLLAGPPAPVMPTVPDPPAATTAQLTVRLLGGDGAARPGRATVRCGATILQALAAAAAPAVEAREGELRLAVPEGGWSVLRAEDDAGSVAVALVPPFERHQQVDLRLGPAANVLQALVLGPDWRTPLPGALVQVGFAPAGRPQEDRGRHRADGHGVLRLADLPHGVAVLRVEGFEPGDGPPHVARVDVGAAGARRDGTAVLVRPPERAPLRVIALVDERPADAPAARLVLRQVDGEPGRRHEPRDMLFPGEQEIVWLLPAGGYEPVVVPFGELAVRGGDGLLRAPAPAPIRMHFAAVPERAQLRLGGDAAFPADVPLRVLAHPADSLFGDDREVYLGAPSWAQPVGSVPVLPGPVDLAVLGRSGVWCTRAPVTLRPGEVDAELVPACWLTVTWGTWDPQQDAGAMLAVSWEGGLRTVALSPRLLPPDGVGGWPRPALGAELAVPQGPLTVECLRAGGEPLWRRTVGASAAHFTLAVE